MNPSASGVVVVAGALAQPHWVPPVEIRARLPRTSALIDLHATAHPLPPAADVLPRELAHDRWLREQLRSKVPGLGPGAMAAVRQVAALETDAGQLPGWLLEPVHFHLAKDHLVLVAGSAHGLAMAQAQELAQSVEPLLAADGMSLTVASPTHWLLREADPALQLDCAASEAAAGRNVAGYLPAGADARRFRRLLNEIQMTWHEHPVNQERSAQGELPINSVWLSGPVTRDAVAAFRDDVAGGRYRLEESLLGPRLSDDRFAWLDALQVLDAQLHEWLTSPQPPSILLCGDDEARWLQCGGAEASQGWSDAIGSGLARLFRRLRPSTPKERAHGRFGHGTLSDGRLSDGRSATGAGQPITDPLARLFSETP